MKTLTFIQRYKNALIIILKIFNMTNETLKALTTYTLNLRFKELFLYYKKFIREYFNFFYNVYISFYIIFTYFSTDTRKIL